MSEPNNDQPGIRKFQSHEIHTEIVRSIEALLPGEVNIVTFQAGENMPITCAFVTEDYFKRDNQTEEIMEYAWNGETWKEIRHL